MILVLLEVKRIVRLAGKDDEGGDDDLEVVMMVVLMVVIGFQRLVSRSPPFLASGEKVFTINTFKRVALGVALRGVLPPGFDKVSKAAF